MVLDGKSFYIFAIGLYFTHRPFVGVMRSCGVVCGSTTAFREDRDDNWFDWWMFGTSCNNLKIRQKLCESKVKEDAINYSEKRFKVKYFTSGPLAPGLELSLSICSRVFFDCGPGLAPSTLGVGSFIALFVFAFGCT